MPVQPHNDAGRSSTRPPEGVYRWGLMFRALWIAVFAPFLIGFLISGVLGHWVFLIAFAFWLGALACVLRAEALTMTPAPLGKQPATRPLRFFRHTAVQGLASAAPITGASVAMPVTGS